MDPALLTFLSSVIIALLLLYVLKNTIIDLKEIIKNDRLSRRTTSSSNTKSS